MIRFLTCALFLLTICGAVIAQQQPSTPWNVTMQTNTVADSNLTVVNRCKKNHQFQIQTDNVPFLHLSANQANVKGGQTQVIPVKFDTKKLAPGAYQGTVLVICQSCKGEATCTQDREVLQVVLRVTGEPLKSGPPPNQPQEKPSPPPQPTPDPQPEVKPTPSTASGTGTTPQTKPGPLDGKEVHVEGTPGGGGGGLWLVKIKLQSGRITNVYIKSEKRPELAFCDDIRIGGSHEEGTGSDQVDTYVDSYEKLPKKPPSKPPTGPKPGDTKPVTPPVEPPKTEPGKTEEEKKKLEEEEKKRQEEEKKRQTEAEIEAARKRSQEETERIKYLLGNIKSLGLINSSGFWEKQPENNNNLIELLKKPIGDLVEEVGKTPIPLDTLDAIKGLYGVVGALLDPCTAAGKQKTVDRLQKGATGRKYELNEALDKTEAMCELLQKLKVLAGGR